MALIFPQKGGKKYPSTGEVKENHPKLGHLVRHYTSGTPMEQEEAIRWD